MGRTVTLSQLRTDAADRLDVPAFSASTFVSQTTIDRWINQSIRRFAGMLIDASGEDYYSKTATIATVNGTASYALPTDYVHTILMRVNLGGTDHKIGKASIDVVGTYATVTSGWSEALIPAYRILGGNIEFVPTPRAVHSVTHRYVPTLVCFDNVGAAKSDLSAANDYLDGHNGWEEWVTLDVCRKHCAAEDRDPSQFILEMREIEVEIKRSASKRDREPSRVRDTYGRGGA
jgi:hypothetical protein